MNVHRRRRQAIALLPARSSLLQLQRGRIFPRGAALAAIVLAQSCCLRGNALAQPVRRLPPGLTLAVIALGLYAL